jgi:integrase
MAVLLLRHQRYSARVRVPKEHQATHGGKEFLQRTLGTSDRKVAQAEADAWEAMLRLEWTGSGDGEAPRQSLRALYQRLRDEASSGAFKVYTRDEDPVEAGIERQLGGLSDRYGDEELPEADEVRLAALQDALRLVQGTPVPRRPAFEATFGDLSDDYMKLWRTQHGLKASNTEQQKLATFALFGGFWGDRQIRDVRKKDAAEFVDALRQMDPLWARSSKARLLKWSQLQKDFGGRAKGLADGTINRHMATLASLWTWAQERDHCEGNNPFAGFHRKLKDGRNVKGYLAWEPDELRRLFDPAPKRMDVTEIMLVAMFSGLRLDEIASLTYGRIMTEKGVAFVQVDDAKTAAGIRRVPLHPRLGWLKSRAKGKPAGDRLWPDFNGEGPGKKARGGRRQGVLELQDCQGLHRPPAGVPFVPQELRRAARGPQRPAERGRADRRARERLHVRQVRGGRVAAAYGQDRGHD